MLVWLRRHLWPRRRTVTFSEELLPSTRDLGDMALALPLRHRLFASLLAELHAHEDTLLRPWYSKVRPEEPVLHLLWSAELVRELGAYVAQALRAAVVARGADASQPLTVLCLGSGAGRLRLYLHHILDKVLVGWGVRVAAAVPAVPSAKQQAHQEPPPVVWQAPLGLETLPAPAEGRLALEEALEAFRPCLIICACMPPAVDWSRSFRACSGVMEYVLLGPVDSGRSGHASETWGGAQPFQRKGQPSQVPFYFREGFIRRDLPAVSALCLGTDDAPGRVGTNAAVAFRRALRPRLSYAQPRAALQPLPPSSPPETALPSGQG